MSAFGAKVRYCRGVYHEEQHFIHYVDEQCL